MEPCRSVAVACLTHVLDTWEHTLRMLLASCDLQAYLVFRDVENTLCTCRSAAVTFDFSVRRLLLRIIEQGTPEVTLPRILSAAPKHIIKSGLELLGYVLAKQHAYWK